MKKQKKRFGGKGTTLTEVLIAVNVLVVALLGFDSALKEAHAQVRGGEEATLARAEIRSAVEQFRAASVRDLDQAVASYTRGVSQSLGNLRTGRNVRLMARLAVEQQQLLLKITWDGVLGQRVIRHVSPVRVSSGR